MLMRGQKKSRLGVEEKVVHSFLSEVPKPVTTSLSQRKNLEQPISRNPQIRRNHTPLTNIMSSTFCHESTIEHHLGRMSRSANSP